MPAESPVPRRASRIRLYAPFILLALVAVAWSVAWVVIRGRVSAGLDDWLAAEASAGRRWTCADRRLAGYPFRVEVSCSSLTLERADLSAKLGRVLAVAQVYNPGHVIVEAQGPLRAELDRSTFDAQWKLLQTSFNTRSGTFQRAAIVFDMLNVRAAPAGSGPVDLAAKRLELHLRPDPEDATVIDAALDATGAVVPDLDAWIGGTEPADVSAIVKVTQTKDLPARPLAAELDRWRQAGGQIALTGFTLAKGPRRVEASGTLRLDDAHRPAGRLESSSARIEGLLGRFIGEKSGLASNLLGALLGPAPKPQPAPTDPNAPALRPVPPLRLQDGRLFVGPLPVPGVRVPPLY